MSVKLVRYWGREARSIKEIQSFATLLVRGASLGWQTHLVYSRPPQDETWLSPLRDIGVQVEYIPRPRRNFSWETVKLTYGLCRRFQPDIIHCDNTHTSPMLGATLARVPVRVWFKRSMQPAFEEERSPTWYEKLAPSVRLTCQLSTAIATVSQAVKSELVDLGIPEQKICVLPNPVDRSLVQLVDSRQARAELKYSDSDVVITALGRAVPVKGWDVLLAAFVSVVRDFPFARLLLVGGTSREDEREFFARLMNVIAHHGLQSHVRFAGHQESVRVALSATDIFVMPSRSEGNSNALNEAFAAGKVCVATKVGNAAELIQDGVNGLLVDRGNAETMAHALALLVGNTQRRVEISKAVQHTPIGPTREKSFDQIYILYQALLRARHGERGDWQRLQAHMSQGR